MVGTDLHNNHIHIYVYSFLKASLSEYLELTKSYCSPQIVFEVLMICLL